MKKVKSKIKWLKEPEEQDYPAALSYLSLIFHQEEAKEFAAGLKRAKVVEFKSKDIFRASGLSLLNDKNNHVKRNIEKIDRGEKLSPLLLVRDSTNGRVIIADGYHRVCAVYSKDEDIAIPCKIV